MKSITLFSLVALLMVFVSSCNKCNNEDPTARVVNNGTSEVDLKITAGNGDITSITELKKGSISYQKSYPSGTATISYTVENIQITETVDMIECNSYDININNENKIVVFSQEKE